MADESDNWCGLIQKSGYRLTAPRKTIVDIMAKSERALGAIDVYDIGRKEHQGLGLVTVYRTIEKLEELNLIQRVHQPDGCHSYLRSETGHQHILICTNCGNTVYFEGDDMSELFAGVAASSGFEIRDHWLQLLGLCPTCRQSESGNLQEQA